MNIEKLESDLAQELPNHLSDYWSVSVTNFGATTAQSAVVSFEDAAFDPQVHGLDARRSVPSVDLVNAGMKIVFTSAPQAARSVFNDIYTEVKAACNALTAKSRQLWTIAEFDRDVDEMAEAPVRTLTVSLNVAAVAGDM